MRFASWKAALSLVLVFHMAAVLAPPFYSATRTPLGTASPIGAAAYNLLEPYINLMFLDHGYAFFAPDPGPSHLVRFRVEFDDGREPVEHMFPDLDRHWPRLLYHRHFMLAEQLHSDYVTPLPPVRPAAEANETTEAWQQRVADWEDEFAGWKQARDRYVSKWRSFENHLLDRYGGSRVSLVRVEHVLVPPDSRIFPFDLRRDESYINLNEYPPTEPLAPASQAPPLQPFAPPLAPPIAPPLEELP